MSIIIKGMEMPKSGIVIAIVASNGAAKLSEELINFPTGGAVNMVKQVEAIELPPHGRLIDADAAIKNNLNIYDEAMLDELRNELVMPTIIEAEE